MEDKNNCPMDPFLENGKEQDEEVFIGLPTYFLHSSTLRTFQEEEQSDKVNMFAKFSKGRVIRLTGSGSRIIKFKKQYFIALHHKYLLTLNVLDGRQSA